MENELEDAMFEEALQDYRDRKEEDRVEAKLNLDIESGVQKKLF